jgi:hypothetical protein
MRGVGWYILSSFGLIALAGCSSSWFEAREPWRAEAEQQCLKSGAVKEGPAVALLRPIQGPGVCGADFPLKVAALGDSPVLGFADELRPPGSVPLAAPAYPQPAYPPAYPAHPSSSYPSAPLSRDGRYTPDPQYSPDPRYSPDPMSESGSHPAPARRGEISRNVPEPNEEYSPDDDDVIVPNSYPQTRGRTPDRLRDAPRTVAPALPPRVSPVPLGRAQTPITTTAAVQPAATLACPIVSALDRWIIDSVQPTAMRWFGQPVVEIRQISAYSCRGMNGQPGAHISEHAFGNALDIAAFTLGDGRKISVRDGWHGLPEEQGFLRDVQAAACEQFTTVLAPGSNRFHYDHIHVDLMRRASGRRICEPGAVSGEQVAARAAQRGSGTARRDDPYAWRGVSRNGGPTGSIRVQKKPTAWAPNEPPDDEDALEE